MDKRIMKDFDPSKEGLAAACTEFQTLKEMLGQAISCEYKIPEDVILMLVKAGLKRLKYYEEKYGFQVDQEDDFFLDDLPDFLDFTKPRGKQAQCNPTGG